MVLSNIYEEVYEVLSYMDKVTVMQVPEYILRNIKQKRNPNFKTNIDKADIFNEDNISKEAVDILCWLNYKYIMDNEKKIKVDKIKNEKIQKLEEYKRNLYSSNNIFEKNKYNKKATQNLKIENITENGQNNEIYSIMKYEKENIFHKILNYIKKYLI